MRSLAAVVFTDVVGFSARMQTNEVETLKLLQVDFSEMRKLCKEHGGSVLKTTGDGLLLTFTSAVRAVACALAIQRLFAEKSKAKPDALQHRVGIHLGDIIFQNEDVMGDGVNIASRLQSEAEPGGICISQTVYDVVKNKLEMHAVSLGPRELKNISQAVPVYRIVLEAQAIASASPLAGATASNTAANAGRRSHFGWMAIGAGLAVVVVAGGLFLRRSRRAAASAPPPAQPTVAQTPEPAASAAPAAGDASQQESLRPQELIREARAQYLDRYDFEGFAEALRNADEAAPGRGARQTLLQFAEQADAMKTWLNSILSGYTRQAPLVVTAPSGETIPALRLFAPARGGMAMVENGAVRPLQDWSELTPVQMGAVIVSALNDARPLPREAVLGAVAFARLYELNSMAEAVTPLLQETAARQGARPGGFQRGAIRQGLRQGARAAP